MKILVSPDKFKGSLNAEQVCDAIKRSILEVMPQAEIILLPLADGGEGTLDVLEKLLDLQIIEVNVSDPLFRKVKSTYGINGSSAYIELARASGFELLTDEERSATRTSSIGTGELIRHAVQNGAKNIFLFVGGSATNDGGVGMATALGFKFLDKNGNKVKPIGMNLSRIYSIEKGNFPSNVHINLVTDVQNQLLGPNGASYQYGPQKGATTKDVKKLEDGMRHVSALVHAQFGKNVSNVSGSGAAGGIGMSVLGLMNGDIQNGIETILKIVGFEKHLIDSDLVITGEGKIDAQTLQGKVVHGVTKLTYHHGVPTYVICGANELQIHEIKELNVNEIVSIKTDELTAEYCMENASSLVTERVKEMLQFSLG